MNFFQSEKTSVQVGAVLTVLLFDLLNRQKNVTNKDQGELLSLQSHYLRCVWFEWSEVTSKIYELSQCRKTLKGTYMISFTDHRRTRICQGSDG